MSKTLSSRVLPVALAGGLLSLVALSAPRASRSDRTAWGPASALGEGTARTFVTFDARGTPQSLGVAISERAMHTLPQVPMHGTPSAAMNVMALPAAAVRQTGFDHVMLDWNPAGHEPDHVYTLPHFDFHFYTITSREREAIVPSNPDWAAKVGAFPADDFVPTGYAAASTLTGAPAAAMGVPFMGMHWLDRSSPEIQPPPHGKPFTTTFLYGTWDGRFIFVEPMITKTFIESVKGTPGGVRIPVAAPARVATPGMYPTAYAVAYDAKSREYRITLEDLVERGGPRGGRSGR